MAPRWRSADVRASCRNRPIVRRPLVGRTGRHRRVRDAIAGAPTPRRRPLQRHGRVAVDQRVNRLRPLGRTESRDLRRWFRVRRCQRAAQRRARLFGWCVTGADPVGSATLRRPRSARRRCCVRHLQSGSRRSCTRSTARIVRSAGGIAGATRDCAWRVTVRQLVGDLPQRGAAPDARHRWFHPRHLLRQRITARAVARNGQSARDTEGNPRCGRKDATGIAPIAR